MRERVLIAKRTRESLNNKTTPSWLRYEMRDDDDKKCPPPLSKVVREDEGEEGGKMRDDERLREGSLGCGFEIFRRGRYESAHGEDRGGEDEEEE